MLHTNTVLIVMKCLPRLYNWAFTVAIKLARPCGGVVIGTSALQSLDIGSIPCRDIPKTTSYSFTDFLFSIQLYVKVDNKYSTKFAYI